MIAVTALVTTSPALRCALAAFGLLHAALSAGIATGSLGPFHLPTLLAGIHAGASALSLFCAAQRAKPRRVDVSGLGQLTVTVQHELRAPDAAECTPVRLLPGTTLLPGLLALELADADGYRIRLLVLPDGVADGSFRRLSAALHSIAAREEKSGETAGFFELIAGGQAPTPKSSAAARGTQ